MCELPVQKRKIFSKNLQDHHQPERAVAGRLPDLLSAFIAALNERACSVRDPRPCSLSLYNTILRFVECEMLASFFCRNFYVLLASF